MGQDVSIVLPACALLAGIAFNVIVRKFESSVDLYVDRRGNHHVVWNSGSTRANVLLYLNKKGNRIYIKILETGCDALIGEHHPRSFILDRTSKMESRMWHDAVFNQRKNQIVSITRDSRIRRREILAEFVPIGIAELIIDYVFPTLRKRPWKRSKQYSQ
jgi:hypothetical protein